MLDKKLIEKEYGFLGDSIFLNVSQVCMPPLRVQRAYGNFMDSYVKKLGEGVVDEAWDIVNGCRPKIQKLINAAYSHEIGFVKNTAEGMGILAAGLNLERGDSIVIADQEHQSTLFPWINQHQLRGIKLNVVESRNHEVNEDDMIAAIDSNTKVLVISSAQFSTGYRAKLEKLGQVCKERGIIFAVDGIQTIGRFVMDVQKFNIDYLCAGSNKGLLGSLGCGFVYCSDRIVDKIGHVVGIDQTGIIIEWLLLRQHERLGDISFFIDACKIEVSVKSVITSGTEHKPMRVTAPVMETFRIGAVYFLYWAVCFRL